jgi:hypothetical protein
MFPLRSQVVPSRPSRKARETSLFSVFRVVSYHLHIGNFLARYSIQNWEQENTGNSVTSPQFTHGDRVEQNLGTSSAASLAPARRSAFGRPVPVLFLFGRVRERCGYLYRR